MVLFSISFRTHLCIPCLITKKGPRDPLPFFFQTALCHLPVTFLSPTSAPHIVCLSSARLLHVPFIIPVFSLPRAFAYSAPIAPLGFHFHTYPHTHTLTHSHSHSHPFSKSPCSTSIPTYTYLSSDGS